MATDTTTQGESPDTAKRGTTASKGGNLADLLTALDLGVRITGLVLAADAPREFSGTSKGGKAYSFANRDIQIWTGNKAVTCTDRRDKIEDFPVLPLGEKASFPVKNVRMNGTVPIFEIETA